MEKTRGDLYLIYTRCFVIRALCSRGNCVGGDASSEGHAGSFNSHLLGPQEVTNRFGLSLLSSAPALFPY